MLMGMMYITSPGHKRRAAIRIWGKSCAQLKHARGYCIPLCRDISLLLRYFVTAAMFRYCLDTSLLS
jgi:hypothetical protein